MSKQNNTLAELAKANSLVIDVSNSAMFAIFAKKKWLAKFDISPLKFILLPLVGIGFVLNAVFASLGFSQMANKNMTRSLGLIATILGAICASVSIFGGMLSDLLWQAPFLIGPYFFLSAVSIGLAFNFSQVIVSTIALLNAPKESIERAQYKRNLVSHLFLTTLLSSIVLSVIFVMLAPTLSPMVGSIAAIASAFLCAASFIHTCLPTPMKTAIDKFFGLTLPNEDMAQNIKAIFDGPSKAMPMTVVKLEKSCQNSLFSRAYRKKVVHSYISEHKYEEAERYINVELTQKIAKLEKVLSYSPNDKKHIDKKNLLLALQKNMDDNKLTTKEELDELYKQHTKARQSFFTYEAGDVEDLVQAMMLLNADKAKAMATLDMTARQVR